MAICRMLDLSQALYHNCPVLPDFEPPKFDYILVGPRDGWKLERVTMNLHTGTHLDAPSHLADFAVNLDDIDVERFQGEAVYVPLTHKRPSEPILRADLEPYGDRLTEKSIALLYTGWGEKRAWTREWIYESPYLSNEGARYLAEKRIRGVGIDHFSIGGTGAENEETHRILLGAGIWVAEGLSLDKPELAEGEWTVMALPVLVREASGAPARVVAFQWGGDGR